MAEGRPVPEAVGAAVSAIVRALPVRAICVLTKTGSTARAVARFRPAVPILAFTPFSDTFRALSLIWGVTPIKTHFATVEDEYYRQVEYILKKRGYARDGETVVLTGGHPIVSGGPTNFIKILTLAAEATAGLDSTGLE
jgi:pyruvate kinase